ncbi:hypothetical protein [Bifidobacterium eulemuris]|uniref:Uncharacterized protein n=1 Tax=Bifidobacterium eulemuris TaxID=1765219 RepID=A0A261GF56_9BIFI|nr:hypothetical protein [Bifidobacterium eulemuris]OZG69496.1 hypothetical protein BEUL_0237 [Bifidobacterium eulemuris]QOL32147.1 hypothetical protein BE0216_06500 [Bifidobacterium eulemuris]
MANAMKHDNNYLRQQRAAAVAFQKRTPERALIWAGSLYLAGMAVVLVLGSMGVIPSADGTLVGGGQVGYVAMYAVASIAVAAVSAFVAFKYIVPGHPNRKVVYWLVFVLVFSLVTFDTLALIVFAVALGFYATRDRRPKDGTAKR